MRYILIFLCSASFATEHLFCLHGFMRTKFSMTPLAIALRAKKREVINWDYPSRSETIDDHALTLIAKLNRVARKNPGEPIHFVTHSMGGLVVRRALNLPGCPDEAKMGRALLLAPPNRGSTFARILAEKPAIPSILGTKAGRELMECENFDHLGPFPPTMRVMVIAGSFGWNPFVKEKNDGKVSVEETRLRTPHKHLTVKAGHSWIMNHPTVMKEARRFFKGNAI